MERAIIMEYKALDVNDIQLDLENPRIKHYMEMYTNEITSEQIALALSAGGSTDARSSYKALRDSIKVNRGIINPIIVNKKNDGTMIVVEGNTRLQIYREFLKKDPNGPWKKIIALVYNNMEVLHAHAIRLQAHLVGPREWDPYSKAKYLYQLSEIDKLPISTIVSYCGGKDREVKKFIDAYTDMKQFYEPEAIKNGMDPDPKDFSKFAELQNRSVIQALLRNQFNKTDFAKWVIKGHIDTAQNVRKLPAILDDKVARTEFLNSNVTEAQKHLNANEKKNKVLENVSMDELVVELLQRLSCIQYNEFKALKNNGDYENQRINLFNLAEQLQLFNKDLEE